MIGLSDERIAAIEARRDELQSAMASPALAPDAFVRLSKDYAQVEPVAAAAREVRRIRAELATIRDMLADPSPEIREMAAEEAAELERKLPEAERAGARKSMVGSGDRSERIRTYNYPQGRVTDHRINLTLHRLEEILEGPGLDEIVSALIAEDEAERLAHLDEQ